MGKWVQLASQLNGRGGSKINIKKKTWFFRFSIPKSNTPKPFYKKNNSEKLSDKE